MTNEIREKLTKIYELVNNGATDGERAAAKKALDRILEKYNISEAELENLDYKQYIFKYTTKTEEVLLIAIMHFFSESAFKNSSIRRWKKEILSNLQYLDYVTIDSAYEYFRRHMKNQWIKVVMPELRKCRKVKTRNTKRDELTMPFMTEYLIRSNLVKSEHIKTVEITDPKEVQRRQKMESIEGGQYNKQVHTNLMLENA